MDRRAFITMLGGSILAAPLAVEAQQTGKVWRIGVLSGPPADAPRWEPFHDSLRGLGYVEGQNIAFEWRSSGGKAERFTDLAADLARLQVDVIVALDNPAIAASQKATKTIPIVMVLAQDPIASGFARSLAQPGGNITGLSVQGTDMQGKIMQILREAIPAASRVGILWVPTEPGRELLAKEAETAARALGLEPRPVAARDPAELERGLATMAREKLGAVLIQPSQLTFAHRARIAELAVKYRLPSIAQAAWWGEAGGLLVYGVKDSDQYDRAAQYVAKILRGAKAADLPIQQPTRFELQINLKTAKALKLTIPKTVILQADKVFE
jgi:putative tryptophan/tyrosine transport system substrate-binding protein